MNEETDGHSREYEGWLAAWNNGDGIDLESWVANEGNFSLAVGYASIFWPAFTLFED